MGTGQLLTSASVGLTIDTDAPTVWRSAIRCQPDADRARRFAEGGESADRVAVEVLGNIASMETALALAEEARDITLTDLLGIHQILMGRSATPELGGAIREEQNWIGGSSYNPCGATFIPPPAEFVRGLLEDLTIYVNGDEHPALAQARRSNRRPRRTVAERPRHRPQGLSLGTPPRRPPRRSELTVESAARLTGRSDVAAGSAINRLAEAGTLVQRNIGKQRYRIFETPEGLELFTSLERAVASPTGDTATEPPVRPVPRG